MRPRPSWPRCGRLRRAASAGPSCSPRSRPWSRCSWSSASSSSSRSTPAAARPSRPRRPRRRPRSSPGSRASRWTPSTRSVRAPTRRPRPRMKNAEAITADGKPKVLYVGAEYCPFCAAERWPMVVALSRFGTLLAAWASRRRPRRTPTRARRRCPFHGSTYTSDKLSFTGYETTTNQQQADGSYPPLDTPVGGGRGAAEEVRLPAVRRLQQRGLDPVREHRRQVADQRREL